eukprot:753374-Hanusia_phi.AAC.2
MRQAVISNRPLCGSSRERCQFERCVVRILPLTCCISCIIVRPLSYNCALIDLHGFSDGESFQRKLTVHAEIQIFPCRTHRSSRGSSTRAMIFSLPFLPHTVSAEQTSSSATAHISISS